MIESIDPFIGVDGPGECLPGPYLPLGLVRLSPDTIAPQKTNGYRSSDPIIHFSHTHVAGTGGMSRYGNIGVVPFVGALRTAVEPFERRDERASCGYYRVTTANAGIHCELTATARVGVHRYQFPAQQKANILIDLGCVVQPPFPGYKIDPNGWPPQSVGGFAEFASERVVVGRGDYRGGWGHNEPYSVFFYAEFDQPSVTRRIAQAGSWLAVSASGAGAHLAAALGFGEVREVNVRVGISYVSVAQARASVAREIGDRNFSAVQGAAVAAWEKVFSRLQVEGGTPAQRTLFATLVTRLLCLPTDLGVDEEFSSWRSGVRHFSDFYCLWDSARNANSLIALFAPELAADFLNCLLDVGERTGWVPDAWIAGHSAFLQGGCSAAVLAGEAAVKNLPGIDYPRALRLLRHDAEQESPDPYYFGRYLKNYRDLGYVTADTPNGVSRHLEYSYQDACLAQLAHRAGDPIAAERMARSLRNVWNLWRSDVRGFAPRRADGTWHEPFDPERALRDSWNDPHFYEGSSREWSWNVAHDFAGLVQHFGGDLAFVEALDAFLVPRPHQPVAAYGQLMKYIAYRSKETLLHVPYLYHYAGRPDRSADRVRWAMETFFQPTRSGLHDNENMGCQSAFYLASAMGIYPVAGQDLYWLTTPVFTRSEIKLGENGGSVVIEAPGAGPDFPYVARATLNGKVLSRAWLRHAEIAGGATLRFELSRVPTAWGTSERPPSPALSAVCR